MKPNQVTLKVTMKDWKLVAVHFLLLTKSLTEL